MEDLDQIIKEIRENTYNNDLADIYIRELLDKDKKYDYLSNFYRRFFDAFIWFRRICYLSEIKEK